MGRITTAVLLSLLVGCVTREVRVDPKSRDASVDAVADAARDAMPPDAGPDGTLDAGRDATVDTGVDGAPDATVDAGTDCYPYAGNLAIDDARYLQGGRVVLGPGDRFIRGQSMGGPNVWLNPWNPSITLPEYLLNGRFKISVWPALSSYDMHCLHPSDPCGQGVSHYGQHWFMILGFAADPWHEYNAVQLGSDQICAIVGGTFYCSEHLDNDVQSKWEAGDELVLEFRLDEGTVKVNGRRLFLEDLGTTNAFVGFANDHVEVGGVDDPNVEKAFFQFVGKIGPICPLP